MNPMGNPNNESMRASIAATRRIRKLGQNIQSQFAKPAQDAKVCALLPLRQSFKELQ
jgi:hypothetical protein